MLDALRPLGVTPAQAGVSHFLEHLLFKGTKRHSAIEIAEIFDGLGASINAATGKESTHLYARFLDTHTERAFDLLAEMLLGPTYPEIDSEREVVLEEIAMYEDEPQDRVHDVLDEAIFGEHPLGRRVLGRAEVISSIPVPDIDSYHRSHYTGSNIVVAAAGNLSHDAIVELAKAHVEPPSAESNGAGGEAPKALARVGFHCKETEQYHITLGGPGLARDDDRRYAMAILDTVFGGSTSSRLFREVREKRGLAYAVGSYTQQFVDGGLVGLYVGTREDNVEEACEIIGRELTSVHTDGISEDELARAKEQGTYILHVDPRFNRTSSIADVFAKLRSGTDIAFVGGMIHYAIAHNRIQEEYVREYTNASWIVGDDYSFADGLFAGYDPKDKRYDRTRWAFALDGQGRRMIGPRFLWCWDARPYPFFPSLKRVWQDGDNYRLGHWVQGKIGNMQLSEIVRDLCLRAGLSNADIDVTSLTDEVSGYVVSERKSLREMISVLQTAFFFDAVESGGVLRFVKRGGGTIVGIDANDLGAAEGDGDRARIRIERAQDVELPISIDVVHLDEARDYQSSTVTGRRQLGTSRSVTTFSLPLILSVEEAQTIAQRALREIWQGRVTLEAKLPTRAIRIDPTDVIEVPVDPDANVRVLPATCRAVPTHCP